MELDTLSFILAVYSAIVATWLAILRIREFRYSIKHRLIVFASVNPPFEDLQIEVANDGRRPVTLKSVEIKYAHEYFEQQLVFKSFDGLPKKLEEGDWWATTLPRREILSAPRERPLEQREYNRLWVIVETLTGQRASAVVRIDPTIIPSSYYGRARDYIAADIFLGFGKQPSNFYPIGIEK